MVSSYQSYLRIRREDGPESDGDGKQNRGFALLAGYRRSTRTLSVGAG